MYVVVVAVAGEDDDRKRHFNLDSGEFSIAYVICDQSMSSGECSKGSEPKQLSVDDDVID
jgi:hypothetical protein